MVGLQQILHCTVYIEVIEQTIEFVNAQNLGQLYKIKGNPAPGPGSPSCSLLKRVVDLSREERAPSTETTQL